MTTKLTLAEVRKGTKIDEITAFKIIKDGHIEISHYGGEGRMIFSKTFKRLTRYFRTRRTIKEGLEETTDDIGYKILYSKGFKKRLTEEFDGDYIIKNNKIFKEIGKMG